MPNYHNAQHNILKYTTIYHNIDVGISATGISFTFFGASLQGSPHPQGGTIHFQSPLLGCQKKRQNTVEYPKSHA